MDNHLQSHILLKVAFDIINHIMRFQYIFLIIHLHMHRCKGTVRTIIVDHEIMHTQHSIIAVNLILNLFHQILIRSLSQQLIQRRFNDASTCHQNKDGNNNPHIAVQIKMNNRREHCGNKNSSRRHNITDGICSSRLHYTGLQKPPVFLIIAVQPQLYGNGKQKNNHTQPAEGHCLRLKNLMKAGANQLKAKQQDGYSNDH